MTRSHTKIELGKYDKSRVFKRFGKLTEDFFQHTIDQDAAVNAVVPINDLVFGILLTDYHTLSEFGPIKVGRIGVYGFEVVDDKARDSSFRVAEHLGVACSQDGLVYVAAEKGINVYNPSTKERIGHGISPDEFKGRFVQAFAMDAEHMVVATNTRIGGGDDLEFIILKKVD